MASTSNLSMSSTTVTSIPATTVPTTTTPATGVAPRYGAPPPPMPPYVQAAFAAARHETVAAAKLAGRVPPVPSIQFGAVPPPPPPPIVAMALEASAKAKRAAAERAGYYYTPPFTTTTTATTTTTTATAPKSSTTITPAATAAAQATQNSLYNVPYTGLLTSWEQEAEMLKVVNDAAMKANPYLYAYSNPSTYGTTSTVPPPTSAYTVPYPTSMLPKTALPTAYGTSAWSSTATVAASSYPVSDAQRIVTDLNGLFATK